MKWTAIELIAVLEKIIAGKENIGEEWDDLGRNQWHDDSFTSNWTTRICSVEERYPPRRSTELFNPDGIAYLQELLRELRELQEETSK